MTFSYRKKGYKYNPLHLIKVLLGIGPKPVEDDVPLRGRTRKEQVLSELRRATGTGRQLSLRMNLKLSIVRVTLTALHKEGLIRDTGKNTGEGREAENIWEVVAIPTWELVDQRSPIDVR